MSKDWFKKKEKKSWYKKIQKDNERISKIAEDIGLTLSEFVSIINKSLTDPIINYKNKDKLEAIFCKSYNITPIEYKKKILTLPIPEYKNKLKACIEVNPELQSVIPEKKKDKVTSKKNQPKMTDEKRIKEFIEIAFRLDDIPKGEKYIGKTMYGKLANESFLKKLVISIEEKINLKYKLSDDKQILLDKMFSHYSDKLLQVISKKKSLKKRQDNEIDYNDDYNYENPPPKKHRSPEY